MGVTKVLTILCIALFGLLGIFLIISRRKRSESNWILGLFFVLWSLNFLDGLLFLDGFYLKHPVLAFWEEPLVFLYGPVIYFYSRALTGVRPRWRPVYLLHLIPALVLLVMITLFYHLQPLQRKFEIVTGVHQLEQPPEIFITVLVVFIHILSYLWASGRLVSRYTREIRNNYSNINLSWLKNTLRSLAFILLLSMVVSFLQFHGDALLFNIGLLALMACMAIFISSILFQAFEEPLLFVSDLSDPKYAGSKLTDEERRQIASKIKSVLDQHKLFLNPETTISDLAKYIQLPPRQVSQVINQNFDQSFFELINSCRIREAQDIIKSSEDPKLTILEVMYKVGFNSKSSFNTQFKRITGITPSEFKRLHQ